MKNKKSVRSSVSRQRNLGNVFVAFARKSEFKAANKRAKLARIEAIAEELKSKEPDMVL